MNGGTNLGRRMGRGIAGLVLLSIGLSIMFEGVGILGLFMFIGGVALLGLLLSNSRSGIPAQREIEPPRRRRRSQRAQSQPQSQARKKMHHAAAKAMHRAGQDPADMHVRLTDVGVLVYSGSNTPTVYRDARLPEDAAYVRPFMVLHSPRRAEGKIRFELVDGSGIRRFIDEAHCQLRAGETFIYPETWLPMQNIDDPDGDWQMLVYAAGVLLGVHDFHWHDEDGGAFRAYLDGDGEITDDLRQELIKVRLNRLSLEDLLAEQAGGGEIDPETAAAMRQAERLNKQHNRRL